MDNLIVGILGVWCFHISDNYEILAEGMKPNF